MAADPRSASACRRICLAVLLAALPLGGCVTDRVVTGSVVPDDYRERHPIVLQERATNLDIFPGGATLDHADQERIAEFMRTYKATGRSRIEILLPDGSPNTEHARLMLPAVRAVIARAGVRGYVSVGTYPADPAAPAPIHISFIGLKGAVASRCGEWPVDLASASSLTGWNNRPYWNLGCAYQNSFATQVADSRDLVEPRAMAPGDVEMRIRAISKVRQGNDPGTAWQVKNTSIGSVGGSN